MIIWSNLRPLFGERNQSQKTDLQPILLLICGSKENKYEKQNQLRILILRSIFSTQMLTFAVNFQSQINNLGLILQLSFLGTRNIMKN